MHRSLLYTQAAFKEVPEQGSIVDFKSAWRFLENDSVIDVQCPCAGADVHVGISSTEGAEAWFVDKLLAFAKLNEIKIHVMWLDDLAITHPEYAAILFNPASYGQSKGAQKP